MCNYIRCSVPQSVILCQWFKIPDPITQYSQNVVFKEKFINNVKVLECIVMPHINQIQNESDVSGAYSSTNLPILIITITNVTVCAKCHHVSQVWNVPYSPAYSARALSIQKRYEIVKNEPVRNMLDRFPTENTRDICTKQPIGKYGI
jgi:hypothetical protein